MPFSGTETYPVDLVATVIDGGGTDAVQNLTVRGLAHGELYTIFTTVIGPAPGDRVEVRGNVRAFEPARNPGGFSELEFARRRGLYAAIDKAAIRLISRGNARDPQFWPARFRLWGKSVIGRLLPVDEAAVLTGMLWGDHRGLSFTDSSAFSATGTSHLLVTAGLHIGFFAGVVLALLRFLTVERKLAASLTIALAWLACIISDAHIPSVRAATMISTVLCARILGTEAASLRSLAYAFCCTLCIDPGALTDASTYLSFSCVFAIVHLAESIERRCTERGVPVFVAKALAITLAAQIGTWALIAADFHQISLCAPLANMVAVPLAVLALAVAPFILLGAASHGAALTLIACVPVHIILTALLEWVRFCAHLPFANLAVRTPALWSLIAYECALVLFCAASGAQANAFLLRCAHRLRPQSRMRAAFLQTAFCARTRGRIAGSVLGVATMCVCLSAFSRSHALRITVLDVGQGDGIVLETPNGHTLLIDTGGRLELHAGNLVQSPAEIAAARVLLPFLQYEGITHIDLLLLTHPHGDHAGGAAPVLRTLPVAVFLDSGQHYGGHAYQDAVQAAAFAHVPRVIATRGQQIAFDDGVVLNILAPEQPLFHDGRNDVNENSIVAMLTYQKLRMLFTGDAGFQAEARLVAHGDDLHADILKVGHHGSAYATSAAFLAAVHPRIALISVGQHNLFHHPALPTLARLQSAGARIYRTDRCGAVTVVNDRLTTMLSCEDLQSER